METNRPVLWVIDSLGVGGAEQLLVNLVTPMRALRYTPIVAHLYPPADLGPALEAQGAQVEWLRANTRGHLPRALLRRLRIIREKRPVLLHAHLFDAGIVSRLASIITRIPLVHTYHNLSYEYEERVHGRMRLRERVDRMSAFAMDRAIAVSDAVANDCRNRLGVDAAVIHNGIDIDRFANGRAGSNGDLWGPDSSGAVRIVCIGRIEERKGQDVAVDAIRWLRQQGTNVRLALVGSAHDPAVVGKALGDEASTGIRFAGPRRDIPEVLASAHIVLNPARTEGLPLTVMEAMAAGKPIVATRVGGVEELITHGVSGLLVAPDDPRAMAEAMQSLIDDPELAGRLGRQAYEDAKGRLSAEVCAELYAKEYEVVHRNLQ